MKKILTLSLTFLVAISLGCAKEDVEEYAMVTFMIGDVTKNNVAIEIGDLIIEKDIILTRKDSFCDVRIGGSIIRIKEKSKVIISNLIRKGNIENTNLGLDIGKMLCKPKKLLKSESFLVKTPTAVAGVRGTRFSVETDASKTTRIKVFDGKLKVAKRVKQFEGSIDKVLNAAPSVSKEEKVVITRKEVEKAEKIVEKVLKAETAKGKEVVIAEVIEKTKMEVLISNKEIMKFAVEDFEKDNKEIIEIKEKPKEVIKKIVKAIMQEKEKPKPEGRLLITRYEIYFIKDGKVVWEGKVINNPIRKDGKIYIASGDYVFCASGDGPVLWRKNLENDGGIEIKDDKLIVTSGAKKDSLDLETGEKL